MEELVAEVHESCSVSVLDGDEVVYVARVPTKRIMTVAISVGTRFPAYATSMVRVLLAHQPAEWPDDYLENAELKPITRRTITDPVKLRHTLARIRNQGFAVVDQELEEGLRSMAVPPHDPDGKVVAAMNVSARGSCGSADAIRRELLPPLQAAARKIEADLGARPAK
ncbi:IclR family transcriptional regulator C-terminal domain-containing protein [Actinopolymorpha sp. B17G11]|uniref:IclR family transcriptional regulator domain-containing protein n=1 Tax=Actinopolymorpha sp. B17G11 TaxID=3160861 RepID=UPI0032E3A125